jgi:ATP-dependent protease HslVU (ClpYQ) peptidase subunit
MTTLIAIQGKGWSVIGCDSRASDENGRLTEMATHKIVENKGVLIAGAGASRGSNILQFGWTPPKPRSSQDLDIFMTKTFIPAMRKAFIESGYDMKEDGDAAAHDSHFIISVRGVIYPIYGDYSWDREERGIYYAGSGADIALGALEAMNYKRVKTPEAAEKVLRKAIEIAIRHDVYSGGEIRTHIQKS